MDPEIVIVSVALATAFAVRWRAAKLGYPSISEPWHMLRSGTFDQVDTRE